MAHVEPQKSQWRLLIYYNFFRGVIGLFFLFQINFSEVSIGLTRLIIEPYSVVVLWTNLYASSAAIGLFCSIFLRQQFQTQLGICAFIDIIYLCLMMYASDGVDSGIGILLMLALMSASFVGSGKLVQFYSLCAAAAILIIQIIGVMDLRFSSLSLPHAVILAASTFVISSIAQSFGKRTFENEKLILQRSIERDNQILINQCIVERMPSGVVIVDKTNRVLLQNPEAFAILGAQKGETLLEPLNTFLLGWRNHNAPPEIDDSAEYNSHEGEFLVKNVNGQDLLARFEETNSTAGESLIFLENFSRMKEQAQQMKLASLGRLTASIAHEIRNPLSAIKHAGELLAEDDTEKIKERLLRIISDNVARLDRIVSDVLDLGRKTQSAPEAILLDEFCRRATDNICANENVGMDVVELNLIPVAILFDRGHLERVFWNLLTNALRYSSQKPLSVKVAIFLTPDESQVELHVIDDGEGVPEENREKIFEPFFTTARQGTGLGLFITRELCTANNARLELAPSAENEGAHFVMTGRLESSHNDSANIEKE